MADILIYFNLVSPPPVGGYRVGYAPVGTTTFSYINVTSSPAIITGVPLGQPYYGTIQAICAFDQLGPASNWYADGSNKCTYTGGVALAVDPGTTTTTTVPDILYQRYTAWKYDCATGDVLSTNSLVAVPFGAQLSTTSYYKGSDNFLYSRFISSNNNMDPAVILDLTPYFNLPSACFNISVIAE